MKKHIYFDVFRGEGWPPPSELERYFFGAPGQRSSFESDNDCWGLSLEGVDGTEHLPEGKGRTDIHLTMLGHTDFGVLLDYHKFGGGQKEVFYSKGDLSRLWEWLETKHGDRMPIGLFIPFEAAWKAVKEFMERDGALPKSIDWIAGRDIPSGAFPEP